MATIDLRVKAGDKTDPLPLRAINRLGEGDTILYKPIVRANEKRPGDVAVVLVPAVAASKEETVIVLEPRPANRPTEWKISRRISVAAFVYGPDGLSRSKVQNFLTKDDELVAQLADYAEKTTQTEALIQALTQADSSPVTVNAALQGFASQYGLSSRIDKTLPADQQAMALFRAVNPAMEGADPLAGESSQRVGETASLATSIAGLFFGSPVGLAAGGTAMVIDLKMLAFPRTDFRSSLAEKLPDDGLAMCGRKTPPAPHTKVAYLWAARIPNTGPPAITIGDANFIPVTQDSPVPVKVADADWKYVERIRKWSLNAEGKPSIPVPVKKAGETEQALEIDLGKVKLEPGEYKLAGHWDWESFTANGTLHVQALGNLGGARLDPLSQDQLIAGKGKVRATLTRGDFEFVTKVQLQKVRDEFFAATAVPFVLPEGLRRGPQEHLDLLVDTKDLEPGKYQLLVTQVDGAAHPVPFNVLPAPPSISNLPVVISRGDRMRKVVLKGEHLDQLMRLECAAGTLTLGPALPQQSERSATVEIAQDLKPGSAFPVRAFVTGHSEPMTIDNAIHIVGPRPAILGAKLSAPASLPIPLQTGELAAGVFVNGVLQVNNLEQVSAVQLSCDGAGDNATSLKMGEHSSSATVERLGADQLFVSFDTSGWPTGCTIMARIDNGPDGLSSAIKLGTLVRLPKIESFRVISSEGGSNTYAGELAGSDLQTIERLGWDGTNGTPVSELPAPIPGEGARQRLRVALPGAEPAPNAPLYVWLRGDSTGRLTTVHQ